MSGQTTRKGAAVPLAWQQRAAAENAIAKALDALEKTREPSVDQLSDLADAIDSLKEGAFDVATDLAKVSQQRRILLVARRPDHMARTLPDLKVSFEAVRRFRAWRERKPGA
jgi:hypothetical protein